MPTITASLAALSSCAYALASSLVIHLESPVAVAILPSRLEANFAVTKGKPVTTCFA